MILCIGATAFNNVYFNAFYNLKIENWQSTTSAGANKYTYFNWGDNWNDESGKDCAFFDVNGKWLSTQCATSVPCTACQFNSKSKQIFDENAHRINMPRPFLFAKMLRYNCSGLGIKKI